MVRGDEPRETKLKGVLVEVDHGRRTMKVRITSRGFYFGQVYPWTTTRGVRLDREAMPAAAVPEVPANPEAWAAAAAQVVVAADGTVAIAGANLENDLTDDDFDDADTLFDERFRPFVGNDMVMDGVDNVDYPSDDDDDDDAPAAGAVVDEDATLEENHDRGFGWSPLRPPDFPVASRQHVAGFRTNVGGWTALSLFKLLLPSDWIDEYVVAMNLVLRVDHANRRLLPHRAITKTDFYRFLGLNLASTQVSMRVRDMWSTTPDPVTKQTFGAGDTMPRSRYQQIHRAFKMVSRGKAIPETQVDDEIERGRMVATLVLVPMWQAFTINMEATFNAGSDLCIDETMMVRFRFFFFFFFV